MKNLIHIGDFVTATVFLVLILLDFAPKIQLAIFTLLSIAVIVCFFYSRRFNVAGVRLSPIVLFVFALNVMGNPAEVQVWFEIVSLCSTVVFTIVFFVFSKRSAMAILVVFFSFYIYWCGALSLVNTALANKQDEVIESVCITQKHVEGRLGVYKYSFDVVRANGTMMNVDVPIHIYESKKIGEYVTVKGTGRFYFCFELWE